MYAVPVDDIAAEVIEGGAAGVDAPDGVPAMGASHLGHRLVYDPSVPFSVHTTPGDAVTLRAPEAGRDAEAFRVADADLRGYLLARLRRVRRLVRGGRAQRRASS